VQGAKRHNEKEEAAPGVQGAERHNEKEEAAPGVQGAKPPASIKLNGGSKGGGAPLRKRAGRLYAMEKAARSPESLLLIPARRGKADGRSGACTRG